MLMILLSNISCKNVHVESTEKIPTIYFLDWKDEYKIDEMHAGK